MRSRFLIAAGAAGLCLTMGSALAQFPPITDPSKDEVKCESSTGKALSKQVGSRAKCVSKCMGTARKTSGPYTECLPPFSGVTLACLSGDPAKSADAKAVASIVKACTDAPGKDRCPECYGAATCTSGQPFVNTTAALTSAQGSSVYCVEASTATPTKEEAKCEDAVSKTLVKWVGSIAKCYDKCNQNMVKGKIAFGTCDVPASDPATQACMTKARDKTVAGIDKACFIAPAVAPTCYDGTALRPNSGAGWTALVEGIVATQTPLIACGSPSGAFLD